MSFLNFQRSSVRIKDHQTDDVFNVYDEGKSLPKTLDDAYGDGFLTISLHDSKSNTWYLNIANQEYIGSLQKLEPILYDWAISEGYDF